MATPEREGRTEGRTEERVSMSELLASCAAASAVSTPPRRDLTAAGAEPEAEEREPDLRDEAA